MKRAVLFALVLSAAMISTLFGLGSDVIFRWRRGSVSRQNLLESSRFRWEDGQFFLQSDAGMTLFPDTLKILAVRAEFQVDEDEETTGDGRFDLSTPSEIVIDPPPHDRDYFEDQLTALRNYYRSVSREKLILVGHVTDSVFTLPYEMGHYNPGTTEEAVDRGLAELFRDAIALADSAGVLFSEYDCFVVFHAGVGRDIALEYDPTPRDIPSAFLNLEDLREHIAGGNPLYEGIEVEGGGFHVREGTVLPETESQEGYEIGLLGTMALMFGFQLGLPALWDVETGRSGIGRWGLMDQGSGNYNGLIPAEPCAWSKVFLGWETPVDTLQGDSLKVACSKAANPDKIYRVWINDHEYFLVEDRARDPSMDGVTKGWDSGGDSVIFRSDGQIEASESFGVIIRVEEYDYGLPHFVEPGYELSGSGILIWHIDEKVIEERLFANEVNGDEDHRGVDLEEADGAQDIGEPYEILDPAYGSEVGNPYDVWYGENEVNKSVNGTEVVSFTPYTHPNSRSYSGANSHIVITDFSERDTVMSFTVENDLLQEGFPQDFGMGRTPYPPLFGDLDGDGETEIVVATAEGKIYAWEKNGGKVIPNDAVGYRVSVSGDTTTFSVALFADAGEEIVAAPVVGDLDGDGLDEIVVPAAGGRILGWTGKDEDQNGLADEILHWSGSVGRVTVLLLDPFLPGSRIVLGTEDGEILALTREGAVVWNQNLEGGSVVGMCLYESGVEEYLVVTTEDGEIFLLESTGDEMWGQALVAGDSLRFPATAWFFPDRSSIVTLANQGVGFVVDEMGTEEVRFGQGILPELPSDPALGDVDGDGFTEVVVTAGGQVWCFNHNGSVSDYFPSPYYERNVDLSAPILGDVDGDGQVDIITVSSEGEVEAYGNDGKMLDGFPLSTGGTLVVPPALLDLNDGDDRVELAAVSERGFLFVWNLPGKYNPELVPWGSYLHDPAHTGMNPQRLEVPSPDDDLMPNHLVYNYPNPTEGGFTTIRYRLEQPARVWIKIFDLGGELIDEFTGPGEPQTDNEKRWDLTDVDSGVYFCRVRAEADGWERVVVFKIAVIK